MQMHKMALQADLWSIAEKWPVQREAYDWTSRRQNAQISILVRFRACCIGACIFSLGRIDYLCLWIISLAQKGACVSERALDLRPLITTCIGRRNDYALQQADRRYRRAYGPLTYERLRLHLTGVCTVGSYVIDEQGTCRFAVFDCDQRGGLVDLVEVQASLAAAGIPAYLEASRRGGHLWVFLTKLVAPALLRRWLLPFCPAGIEFYPKRDWASWEHPGSLVRVPLGVHQVTGEWYPFVHLVKRRLVPVASTPRQMVAWLSQVERALPPVTRLAGEPDVGQGKQPQKTYSSHAASLIRQAITSPSIQAWCAQQDAVAVIGRYVVLDRHGLGCCPFGWHHEGGNDEHPSLWVHAPRIAGGACWYCHTGEIGGSLFDFLRLFLGVDARTLWARIRAGEQF